MSVVVQRIDQGLKTSGCMIWPRRRARFTFGPGSAVTRRGHPDGRHVSFMSACDGIAAIGEQAAGKGWMRDHTKPWASRAGHGS
jgi:hypothetical protein